MNAIGEATIALFATGDGPSPCVANDTATSENLAGSVFSWQAANPTMSATTNSSIRIQSSPLLRPSGLVSPRRQNASRVPGSGHQECKAKSFTANVLDPITSITALSWLTRFMPYRLVLDQLRMLLGRHSDSLTGRRVRAASPRSNPKGAAHSQMSIELNIASQNEGCVGRDFLQTQGVEHASCPAALPQSPVSRRLFFATPSPAGFSTVSHCLSSRSWRRVWVDERRRKTRIPFLYSGTRRCRRRRTDARRVHQFGDVRMRTLIDRCQKRESTSNMPPHIYSLVSVT